MPAQLKKRTTTGATNVKKAQSKTNINLCVCKTCTCGRHGCAGGDHTSFSVTDKKSGISSETESRAQYHQHPPQEHKLASIHIV